MTDVHQSVEGLVPQVACAGDLPQKVLDNLFCLIIAQVVQVALDTHQISPCPLGPTVWYHEPFHVLEHGRGVPVAPRADVEDGAG